MSIISFPERLVNQSSIKPPLVLSPKPDNRAILADLHTLVDNHAMVFRREFPAYFRFAILGYGVDVFARSSGAKGAVVNVELWAAGTPDMTPYHQWIPWSEVVLPQQAKGWGLSGWWTYREGLR